MGTVLIIGARTLVAINPGKGNISPPTTGWCTDSAGVPTDAQLAAASSHVLYLYQPPPLDDGLRGADLTLGYDQSTPTFLLDGVDFVSFNNLPAGFIFTSLNVSISLQLTSAVGSGVSSNPGSLTFGVSPILPDTTFNGIFDFPNPALDHSWNEDLIPTGFSITPNEFITWQPFLGGTVNTNRGVSPSALNITVGLVFEGTYEIQRFQFSIDTESPVEQGDTITFSSPDKDEDDIIDFNKVTDVTVTYKTTDGITHNIVIPASDFTSQEQHILTFILPDIGDAPKVEFSITGTQFSGSVPLGTLLTIFFLNGTGIYRIVPNKTNDTLYVQDYDPVETVDVKIPNPFFKTGFLPDA